MGGRAGIYNGQAACAFFSGQHAPQLLPELRLQPALPPPPAAFASCFPSARARPARTPARRRLQRRQHDMPHAHAERVHVKQLTRRGGVVILRVRRGEASAFCVIVLNTTTSGAYLQELPELCPQLGLPAASASCPSSARTRPRP